jgi:hypothetical protein
VTTLEDGAQQVNCELTPRVRITILFFKDKNQVASIRIQPAIDATTRQQLHTLLAHDDGPAIIEQVFKSQAISSKDIVNVG